MSERVTQQRFAKGLSSRSTGIVLFEDRDLVVVNKPAGLLSHKANGVIGVQEVVRDVLGPDANIAHRLDCQTSGVLLVTKTRRARRRVAEQFGDKGRSGMKKLYVALLDGEFSDHEVVEVSVALRKNNLGRMEVVNPDQVETTEHPTKDSLTYFIPSIDYRNEHGEPKTLTAVEIVTGRTHQIRVVAADYLRRPITGDRLYNDNKNGAPRQMLHALQLSLALPGTEEFMTFEAPIPDDFQETVGGLTSVIVGK